nr:MAG TPA: Monocytic leukemia zinc finger protein finger, acetyl transferase, DNA [Caudoviricetes sp.]
MVSKVLTLFFTSLLSLSTATGTTTAQTVESPQVYEESVDSAETPEYTEEDANEEDSMTVEEKYAHNQNKEDCLEDDGETLIWYDVPYCDDHDFEVLGDETETMYICKKCGYSYSEFPEESEDEPEEELPEESDSDSEE